jgi:redox-sensitive bicupin YhaK (pirin superfamily)
MEIVTYVLEGALEHQDSLGSGGVLRAGELQRMSAGTGILHSEYNASEREPVHLYQIWLFPDRRGLRPGYEQKALADLPSEGAWRRVASPGGRGGSLTIHQDAELHLAALRAGEQAGYELKPGRAAWVQVVRGRVDLNGQALAAGDGAAVQDEGRLRVSAEGDAEVLLFDLA